jgi:hypothetical protein
VLSPHPEADEARRDAAEQRHAVEQFKHERHLVELGLAHHQRRQHPLVDDLLCALNHTRRE